MAKAYIKLGDKAKAWKTLQDAIKCNYDNWQIWDNLMIVSIDLGEFSEVCTYNFLIIIKHKIAKFFASKFKHFSYLVLIQNFSR